MDLLYEIKFIYFPVPGLMGNKLYVEGFGVNYPAELSPNKCPRDIPLRKSWIGKEFGANPKCELYLLQSVRILFLKIRVFCKIR
jgi:hypothetical protein